MTDSSTMPSVEMIRIFLRDEPTPPKAVVTHDPHYHGTTYPDRSDG